MTKTPPVGGAARLSFRIERWQRRASYATGLLLLVTGIAWLAAHYFMRPVTEFGEGIHPLEPWSMKLHGAAAMAALFLLGALLHVHIRRALRAGRNLLTGWSMIVLLGLLVLTGFGLYYLAGDAARAVWSALHWATGLVAAVAFVLHIVVGRKSVR